jgi:hypothetical protein
MKSLQLLNISEEKADADSPSVSPYFCNLTSKRNFLAQNKPRYNFLGLSSMLPKFNPQSLHLRCTGDKNGAMSALVPKIRGSLNLFQKKKKKG